MASTEAGGARPCRPARSLLTIAALLYLSIAAAHESFGATAATDAGPTPPYALQALQRAAEAGRPDAQIELARRHADGDGVPMSRRAAAHWLRLAAEQGHPLAQARLGIAYYMGRGVPRDVVEAYKWLDVAISMVPSAPQCWRDARRRVETRMTRAELARARRSASEFRSNSMPAR
jgi:TPR repeat protein